MPTTTINADVTFDDVVPFLTRSDENVLRYLRELAERNPRGLALLDDRKQEMVRLYGQEVIDARRAAINNNLRNRALLAGLPEEE